MNDTIRKHYLEGKPIPTFRVTCCMTSTGPAIAVDSIHATLTQEARDLARAIGTAAKDAAEMNISVEIMQTLGALRHLIPEKQEQIIFQTTLYLSLADDGQSLWQPVTQMPVHMVKLPGLTQAASATGEAVANAVSLGVA